MRIIHVVTLVSADNAFGGPVSVAREQAAALARRGHDVSLLAGWDGVAELIVPGVQVELFRTRKLPFTPGFFGLLAPGLVRRLRQIGPGADVVHLHLARDLVMLPAAHAVRRRGVRVVTQTHGMVMPDDRAVAKLVDGVVTRRVLRDARPATALTEVEQEGLDVVAARPLGSRRLPNGIALRAADPSDRRADRHVPRVVFCARLHPRKRVLAFAQMADLVLATGREATFEIAGPDEGDLPALQRFITSRGHADRIRYRGALEPTKVRDYLAEADVFVLPSEREPFPMTLLEAMAEGTATVITDGCMIADQLRDHGGPVVAGSSPEALADAVTSLLDDPEAAHRRGLQGRSIVADRYSIEAVAEQLEELYTGR